MADFLVGHSSSETSSQTHSRGSSMSSERSNKENVTDPRHGAKAPGPHHKASDAPWRDSDSGSDVSGGQLVLMDGGRLKEESRTEVAGSGLFNPAFLDQAPPHRSMKNGDEESLEIPARHPLPSGGLGTARQKVARSGNQVTQLYSSPIPEEEITIPADGNLASFSADSLAHFLRCLRLEERLVAHLHRQGLDGKKFGRLKDADLEKLHLSKNPVLVFFRDRTAPAVAKKAKQRVPFIL